MHSKCKIVDAGQYDSTWIKETWGWDTAEEFIRSQGRNIRPRVRYCLKLAALRPGMRILDVGCGRGEVVLYCARRGMYAVGVDYSKDAISIAEQAKATHKADEQKRMKFVCDDVKNIKGESFDRIFMLDLVEHLHDWELDQLFQVCKSLLRPTGEIIIHTLPNRWVYEIAYRKLLRMVMPWLPDDPRDAKERAIHVNEMSITHLHDLLQRNGFTFRIWLDDLITSQARWHKEHYLTDKRRKFYRWMQNRLVSGTYRSLCLTPLRILIANDIFAVAVHEGQSVAFRKPMRQNWTESIICCFHRS